MRQVWTAIWSLLTLFLGSAAPIATGLTQYASAFETSGIIANKAMKNFEASVDLDAVSAELALRKAKAEAATA